MTVSEDSEQACIDVNGDGKCATDTTGDGLVNDVNGDGKFDLSDVRVLFSNPGSDAVQSNPEMFNFDGDENPDDVDISDVRALFSAFHPF